MLIKQHASDYFSGRTYIEVCGVTADDTFFSCLPLFHSNAQVLCAYPALLAGGLLGDPVDRLRQLLAASAGGRLLCDDRLSNTCQCAHPQSHTDDPSPTGHSYFS